MAAESCDPGNGLGELEDRVDGYRGFADADLVSFDFNTPLLPPLWVKESTVISAMFIDAVIPHQTKITARRWETRRDVNPVFGCYNGCFIPGYGISSVSRILRLDAFAEGNVCARPSQHDGWMNEERESRSR